MHKLSTFTPLFPFLPNKDIDTQKNGPKVYLTEKSTKCEYVIAETLTDHYKI